MSSQQTAWYSAFLMDTINNYSVFTIDLDGHVIVWDVTAQNIHGYTSSEILGKHFSICYCEEDQASGQPQAALETAIRKGHVIEEGWRVRRNSSRYWASSVIWPVRDASGALTGFTVVTHDITDRREAEEKLRRNNERLQQLTARLAEVETAERRQLANELHDRAGQNLTALGINLNIVRSQLSQESAKQIGTRLDDCLILLEDTTERIRDVMATLRPQVLEDYGLVAALRWYGDTFAARTEIPVTVITDGDNSDLSRHIEDTLYRVVLEALNNVAKHAQATSLVIQFTVDTDRMKIEVIDDGVGFEPREELTSPNNRHWGLQTMIERIEAIGGTFRIVAAPGIGTQILIELPR